jgi:hypothetical protein
MDLLVPVFGRFSRLLRSNSRSAIAEIPVRMWRNW